MMMTLEEQKNNSGSKEGKEGRLIKLFRAHRGVCKSTQAVSLMEN